MLGSISKIKKENLLHIHKHDNFYLKFIMAMQALAHREFSSFDASRVHVCKALTVRTFLHYIRYL